MPADPRMLEMLSYYRDAELHGASLLLRLLKMTRELPEVQVKLTLHVAQETRHAWLWTERIRELGGWPVDVRGYQARIGMHTVPRAVVDLLALSIVVETRSLARGGIVARAAVELLAHPGDVPPLVVRHRAQDLGRPRVDVGSRRVLAVARE
jgi:hypothetical protein